MNEKKNILLVDDDVIYLFIAQKTINKLFPNAVITVCKNGQEALSKLDFLSPDVMFLDINMPVLNGWELLEKLKGEYIENRYPIYIVSSSIDENDRRRAASHKFVKGYLEKPISESKLLSTWMSTL